MDWFQIIFNALTIFSGLVFGLLMWLNKRNPSPKFAIFARWSRWIFIASGSATIADGMGYPSEVLPLVGLSGFMGWFLLESGYSWLAVMAFSKSNLPLFPYYEENTRGDEWPSDDTSISIRGWLRSHQFTKVQALYAKIEGEVLMRVSIYENEEKTTRITVFIFSGIGSVSSVSFSFQSKLEDNTRIITDNIYLPFGGFYPENYYIERKPWKRSIDLLSQLHQRQCETVRDGRSLKPFDQLPLNELNVEQRNLEQLNRELGFLSPVGAEEEEGRITPAGRFRVWAELWMLSYFGKPRQY